MKVLHIISFILVVIGGLNWLLVGVAGYDVVADLLAGGNMESVIAKSIYILVGLATIVLLFTHKRTCEECGNGGSEASSMAMGGDISQGGM